MKKAPTPLRWGRGTLSSCLGGFPSFASTTHEKCPLAAPVELGEMLAERDELRDAGDAG